MATLVAGSAPAYPHRDGAAKKPRPPKDRLTVRIEPDGRLIHLDGREAWACRKLIEAGRRGCTPLDTPGPRWSAYIHALRTEFGIIIETEHVSHFGDYPGHHAKYIVRSDLTIVEEVTS